MTSRRDKRVDCYIAEASETARPLLEHLRELIHQACPEVEETIKWNVPFFTYHGNLCGMTAFKAHCGFGFWHQGMKVVTAAHPTKAGMGMSNYWRITSLNDLPSDTALKRYLKEAVALNLSGKPAQPKNKPKPDLPVPSDLAAALRKNYAAEKTFKSFPPGARRDYVEWITQAKRSETRAKRLATAIEWLAVGKKRNWKYAKCGA